MIATELLDLFPTPSPLASESQFDRFEHRDLEALTTPDLERELVALRLVNYLLDSEWHREREVRVAEEIALRAR